MPPNSAYPIGIPGQRWGPSEVSEWLARQSIKRSYQAEVLDAIESLRARYEVIEYGRLDCDPDRYPLFALKSPRWNDALPLVLVTGGVHGYETSGVLGALRFLKEHAQKYDGRVNLIAAPCVSPWGFEVIQRWNVHAIDPNRSFFASSPAQESALLMQLVAPFQDWVRVHIDLHETTDTDESEFRPALAARDGEPFVPGEIPDGFYLVDDSGAPNTAFQRTVLAAVAQVTHIAAADENGEIIGSPIVAPGIIEYPLRTLGLCAGISGARFKTTTEVYPDSPRASDEICIAAQVTAVAAAIEYAIAHSK